MNTETPKRNIGPRKPLPMKIAKMPDGESEIYNAVQGEGLTQGLPIVFVRQSLCNLACKWCDSYYTWYFKGDKRPHDFAEPVDPKDYIKYMTPQEVADDINKARKGHRNVLFTGGEPLLQYPMILQVIDILKSDGSDEWYFEIETNGTLKMPEKVAEQIDQINSSPKLDSSGNCASLREKPEAIASFLEHYHAGRVGLCFKFVVMLETWEEDMKEIEAWRKSNNVPKELIYLMPEGTTRDRIQKATLFLNEVAMKEDYKVSTRLQILIYGDKRAV